MNNDLIVLSARFVDADTGSPLDPTGMRVRFLDADALVDDLLGECELPGDGIARIIVAPGSYRSGLFGSVGQAFGELEPDVYCELFEGDRIVYRTQVKWDLNPEAVNAASGLNERTLDLGTYRVRRGEGLGEIDVTKLPWTPPM